MRAKHGLAGFESDDYKAQALCYCGFRTLPWGNARIAQERLQVHVKYQQGLDRRQEKTGIMITYSDTTRRVWRAELSDRGTLHQIERAADLLKEATEPYNVVSDIEYKIEDGKLVLTCSAELG